MLIKLTQLIGGDESPIWVNPALLESVEPHLDGARLRYASGYIRVQETPQQALKALSKAEEP